MRNKLSALSASSAFQTLKVTGGDAFVNLRSRARPKFERLHDSKSSVSAVFTSRLRAFA